jgi:hypothetical protein
VFVSVGRSVAAKGRGCEGKVSNASMGRDEAENGSRAGMTGKYRGRSENR